MPTCRLHCVDLAHGQCCNSRTPPNGQYLVTSLQHPTSQPALHPTSFSSSDGSFAARGTMAIVSSTDPHTIVYIAEREARQLMVQCGRIWASATIKICPATHWNAIIVAPHVNYVLDPRTRAPCDLMFVVCRCAV